jgi:hypothetical protein
MDMEQAKPEFGQGVRQSSRGARAGLRAIPAWSGGLALHGATVGKRFTSVRQSAKVAQNLIINQPKGAIYGYYPLSTICEYAPDSGGNQP